MNKKMNERVTEKLTEIHTSKVANSWLRMIHQLSPGPAHHTAPLKSTPLLSLVRTACPDVTATPEDPGSNSPPKQWGTIF